MAHLRCSEGWGSHVSYKIARMRLIYDLFGVSNLVYSGQVAEGVGEEMTLTAGILLINSGPCAVFGAT